MESSHLLSPLFAAAAHASRSLVTLSGDQIDAALRAIADAIMPNAATILKANAADCAKMDPEDPKYDRLLLNEERLKGIAHDMKNVASLPSPLGNILEERTLANGLEVRKISVPIGVIGMIYESRPNVTYDAFAICFKAGNACVLKGGAEAHASNEAAVALIQDVLKNHKIDPNAITLLPPDNASVGEMLLAVGMIDVVIPRGGQGLIRFVRENAKVPVIETGAGICHTYVDASADITSSAAIIFNAKTTRPSVCNSLDCMIIHREKITDLPAIIAPLAKANVIIDADEDAYEAIKESYPKELLNHATDASFGTEFLSLRMSIKTVGSLDEALHHIAHFSSGHSEAIVAEDTAVIEQYLQRVDAACIYANASTRFTDGAMFGLGAEIGISTQKLHARGPMALKEMTSYKWIVRGDGQVRI